MLYFFKCVNNDTTFYLVKQNEFVVGRKDCDFVIEKDSSVSRQHAKLRIKKNGEEEIVTLEDLGSKYKTYHNSTEVTPKVEIRLNIDDKVQFGGLFSLYIFQQQKIITTATKLPSNKKALLHKDLKLLRGQYIDTWSSDCTYLTLEQISLTVKVLQALLDEKPIVLPSFWTKFAENVYQKLPPPNISDFNDPPIAEALLNKVEFRNAAPRKDLFKNKIFLFFSEAEKKPLHGLIEKAGGTAISWDVNRISVQNIQKSSKEFLIMQTSHSYDDKAYENIIKHFSKQNQRTIPTPEIAMAIIHGSCEKDCNPNFNRAKEVFQTTAVRGLTQHNPIVENTQTQTIAPRGNEILCQSIPETVAEELDIPPIKKRKIEKPVLVPDEQPRQLKVQEREQNIVKRETEQNDQETEDKTANNSGNQNSVTQSQKRKAEDEPTEGVNPFMEMYKKSRRYREAQMRRGIIVEEEPQDSAKPSTSGMFNNNSRNRSHYDSTLTNRNEMSNASRIFTSTKIEEANETPHCTVLTINSNAAWISTKTKTPSVDLEVVEQDDDDLQRFVNLFRNKVVVEVVSQLTLRPRSIERNGTRDEVDFGQGLRNFKKFKKVKPVHPQTKIIGRDSFVILDRDGSKRVDDTRQHSVFDSDDE